MNDQTKTKEENAVRAVLRNEITWIFFIAGAIFSMVTWVIIPINSMQKDIAQVKLDIVDIKNIQNSNDNDHTAFNTRLTRVETKLNINQ